MTDRFELLEQLGRGGMGTVWKARDTGTGEIVALKVLHQMYVDDPDYVARFEREVEIAKRIVSPFVVRTIGFGKRDGVPYVAMEHVAGGSLRDRIKLYGPVGWEEAKRIAVQLTTALVAAHDAGVIHRDIKPSNVLLDEDGNVELADFGIARASDLTRMTGSVTVLGTPAYMSPDSEPSAQSDLYALGCVLYELMTGAPPFEGESQQQVLIRHIREAPKLESLPGEARSLVGWLLEKDAATRPGGADVLLEHLTRQSMPYGPSPRSRRRGAVADPTAPWDAAHSRPFRRQRHVPRALLLGAAGTLGASLALLYVANWGDVPSRQGPSSSSVVDGSSGMAVSAAPEAGAIRFVRTAKTLAVEAKPEDGTLTGIVVDPGEEIEISGTGTWCVAPEWCGGTDGARDPQRNDPRARLPTSPIGSIMARIGGQGWVSVESQGTFTATTRGELTIAMNDVPGGYSDNTGRLWVTVRIFTR